MIRRLYFYLVAFVSFAASVAALNQLLGALGDVWLGQAADLVVGGEVYRREVLAASAGVLIVAVPIFLLHWNLIQRQLTRPGERTSGLRKLFLYGALGLAFGYALYSGYNLVEGLILLALGQPVAQSELWPNGWFQRITMLIAGLLLQSYFHRVLVTDGDYGHETGIAVIPRRLFHVIAGLVGLMLILFGASDVLETVWRLAMQERDVLTAGEWWRAPIAGGAALMLVGLPLSAVNWRRWQGITLDNPAEGRSAFRRLYLYAGVVVGAAATLAPAASLLREAILMLLGSSPADRAELVDKLATPVGLMPVGIAIWWWHRRVLRIEAERYEDSPESILVRRIYYYVVAATGLVLVWFGASETVGAVLDGLIGAGSKAGGSPLWVEPLATGLSLLAVGVPVWMMHWRTVQAIARRPDGAGLDERASLPRRVYLYGAALAGALLILYYLARVIYRLLLSLMGDPYAGLLSVDTADEMARAVISALLWIVHVSAIRMDSRLGTVQTADVDEASQERERLVRRISELESELARAREELTRLDSAKSPEPT